VLYGGAVHLSKESLEVNGEPVYGALAPLTAQGWGAPIDGAYVYSLSQEHGLVDIGAAQAANIKVGDLVAVLPVHSCLTANLYTEYLTTEGQRIDIKR
jgi:D-serine deaminase-like pyridoxal phosphate-dependent protein